MANIARGTTPTFTLTFSDETVDLTTANNVYVTFLSGNTKITKTGTDLTITALSIGVHLSQEETLSSREGIVNIQANWTTADGNRVASEIASYTLTRQLLDEVIE